MATLDDVVSELQQIRSVLMDIRDASTGMGGGGVGPAAAGTGAGGAADGQSGMLSMAGGGLGRKVLGGLSLAAIGSALDRSGATAFRRASTFGATSGQARGAGLRQLTSTITGLPGGAFLLPRTAEFLEAEGRARSTVSGLAESVARAGGRLDASGLETVAKRSLEIEEDVQRARIQTRNIFGGLTRERQRELLKGDVFDNFGLGGLFAGNAAEGARDIGRGLSDAKLDEIIIQLKKLNNQAATGVGGNGLRFR